MDMSTDEDEVGGNYTGQQQSLLFLVRSDSEVLPDAAIIPPGALEVSSLWLNDDQEAVSLRIP